MSDASSSEPARELVAAGYEAFHASVRRVAARLGAGRLGDRAAAVALFVPDLLVFARRALADERVPKDVRGEVYAALIYLALPFDIVPETLFGPAGLVDDAVVVTRLLDTILNRVDEALVRELWPGDRAVLHAARGLAGEGRRLFKTGFRTGFRLLTRRLGHAAARALSEAGLAPERLLSLVPGPGDPPDGSRAQGLANGPGAA